ncbi:MAG: hypothetical protein WAW80_01185 [Candidatus Saccharimonadales bacterium]
MKKTGFTIVEVVIVIVTLFVIGAVGYLAYTNIFTKNDTISSTTVTTSPQVSKAPDTTVTAPSDLDKVTGQLDDLSIDDNDASDFESSTTDF